MPDKGKLADAEEAGKVLSDAAEYLKKKIEAVPSDGGKESDGVKGARSTLAHCAGLIEAEAARLAKEG